MVEESETLAGIRNNPILEEYAAFTIWNSNSSADMSDFQESGISFKFSSPKWAVVKYDEHLAHKR